MQPETLPKTWAADLAQTGVSLGSSFELVAQDIRFRVEAGHLAQSTPARARAIRAGFRHAELSAAAASGLAEVVRDDE